MRDFLPQQGGAFRGSCIDIWLVSHSFYLGNGFKEKAFHHTKRGILVCVEDVVLLRGTSHFEEVYVTRCP